jgi:hypothetical protein
MYMPGAPSVGLFLRSDKHWVRGQSFLNTPQKEPTAMNTTACESRSINAHECSWKVYQGQSRTEKPPIATSDNGKTAMDDNEHS